MSFENSELLAQIKPLESFAIKLCKNSDDAKDLLQSTLLRALENREKFISGSNMFSWASKIMFNLFVSDYRRKMKRESQYEFTREMMDAIPEAENQSNIADLHRIDEVMETMPDYFRSAIVMVLALGMSYDEAARELGVPSGTVRSRLSRARALLDKKLKKIPPAHIIAAAGNRQAIGKAA